MLNQLIESKSNRESEKTRGKYLLTTSVLVVALCFSSIVWSLFAKDLGIGREALEMSELVAPLAENAPPAPIVKEESQKQPLRAKIETPTRQTNTLRVDESPITPTKISVVPTTQKARPAGSFLISDKTEIDSSIVSLPSQSRDIDNNAAGISQISEPTPIESVKKIEPPPMIKKASIEPAPKPKQTMISGGVVNGQAINLPKPPYPATAKAVGASGNVSVEVMIDEAGNVVSAKAISGHPLLKAVAEKAAQGAKFKPTLLTGQPVKVSGVIVYKFST